MEAQKSAVRGPLLHQFLHQFFLISDDLSALASYGGCHSPVNERSCIGVSTLQAMRNRPNHAENETLHCGFRPLGSKLSKIKRIMHSLATAMPPLTQLVRIFTIPNCSMRHSRVWDSANVAMGCSRHSRISIVEPCGNQWKDYRFSHETWC